MFWTRGVTIWRIGRNCFAIPKKISQHPENMKIITIHSIQKHPFASKCCSGNAKCCFGNIGKTFSEKIQKNCRSNLKMTKQLFLLLKKNFVPKISMKSWKAVLTNLLKNIRQKVEKNLSTSVNENILLNFFERTFVFYPKGPFGNSESSFDKSAKFWCQKSKNDKKLEYCQEKHYSNFLLDTSNVVFTTLVKKVRQKYEIFLFWIISERKHF